MCRVTLNFEITHLKTIFIEEKRKSYVRPRMKTQINWCKIDAVKEPETRDMLLRNSSF